MPACCTLRVSMPPKAGKMRTVADFVAACEYTRSNPFIKLSQRDGVHLSPMIRSTRSAADFLGRSPQAVLLDQLVDLDEKFVKHVMQQGPCAQTADQYVCDKKKALWHAHHDLGWGSSAYDRHLAWLHIRETLGSSRGWSALISLALEERLLPHQIDRSFFERLRANKEADGCSPRTIRAEEEMIRTAIRQALLESSFPLLDLSKQIPDARITPEEDLPPQYRRDLDKLGRWKTDPVVDDRLGELRISNGSWMAMRKELRRIHWFAVHHVPGVNVMALRDIFCEAIICPYIDFLRASGVGAASVHAELSSIHCLTYTYPSLKRRKYPWFKAKLARLRPEPRWRIDERKDKSSVPYEVLAELPKKIRAKLKQSRDLSEVDIAWLVHDELFATWSLHLPWRFINIAGCGIQVPAPINLMEAELPLEMREDPELPMWVKRALRRNEHHMFLQFIFWKSQCKTKWAVRGIVPRELLQLYYAYKDHYRRLLVGAKDDGFLFQSRAHRRMVADEWYSLYRALTEEHLGRAVRPHLTRDIFAEHWLRMGKSLSGLQAHLWHRRIKTTINYARRFNTSHGSVLIETDSARGHRLKRAA